MSVPVSSPLSVILTTKTSSTFNGLISHRRYTTSPSVQLGYSCSITRNSHCILTHYRTLRRQRSLLCCSSSYMPVEESISALELQGSLLYSRAYWVGKSIIAWNVDIEDGSCYLYASKFAALSITDDGIQGQDVKIKLEEDNGGLPANVIEKFPHIRDYRAFNVSPILDAGSLLKCQLAVATFSSDGKCISATGLQLPGVLDELFSYNGPLGAVFSQEAVSLYLWAPTAQAVRACIYREPSGGDPLEIVQLEEVNGVWSTNGPKSWGGCYYVYEVSVYHPSTMQIEKCYANDPYARGYAGCLS